MIPILGPNVVPQYITVEHAREVAKVFQRKPLIWENSHANDYDYGYHRLLYTGPFDGREVELKNEVSGLLLNPNCEYEANYVPFFSLGEWNKAKSQEDYDKEKVFEQGLVKWLAEFNPEIRLDEVRLFANLNFLPFAYGREGLRIWDLVRFLIENVRNQEKEAEFETVFKEFQANLEKVTRLHRLIGEGPNKVILI